MACGKIHTVGWGSLGRESWFCLPRYVTLGKSLRPSEPRFNLEDEDERAILCTLGLDDTSVERTTNERRTWVFLLCNFPQISHISVLSSYRHTTLGLGNNAPPSPSLVYSFYRCGNRMSRYVKRSAPGHEAGISSARPQLVVGSFDFFSLQTPLMIRYTSPSFTFLPGNDRDLLSYLFYYLLTPPTPTLAPGCSSMRAGNWYWFCSGPTSLASKMVLGT